MLKVFSSYQTREQAKLSIFQLKQKSDDRQVHDAFSVDHNANATLCIESEQAVYFLRSMPDEVKRIWEEALKELNLNPDQDENVEKEQDEDFSLTVRF